MRVITVLNNECHVTAMVYLNDKTIWVADVNGWLSVWHLVCILNILFLTTNLTKQSLYKSASN